jgi:2-hydroxychromene-2-carboxylate isomerase
MNRRLRAGWMPTTLMQNEDVACKDLYFSPVSGSRSCRALIGIYCRVTEVRFYFDFISPFSWLALTQAPAMAQRLDIRWDLRPVVYSRLLDAHGLMGPGEVPAKRSIIFTDAVRCAQRLGKDLIGPPSHPFRSIEALRVACLFRQKPAALDLCVALADAAWGQGRDLSDLRVLTEVVTACGLPATNLAERIQERTIKNQLKTYTQGAVTAGIFGVPSFVLEGEVLWGHDRLAHLEDLLTGKLVTRSDLVEGLLNRPRGLDRPGVRERFSGKGNR